MQSQSLLTDTLYFSGIGLTSKANIKIEIKPGVSGIRFILKDVDSISSPISAQSSNVVNTLRNVVIGSGKFRLCLVEHLLAAIGLFGLDKLDIIVDGPELPIGDGSARLWVDLFKQHNLAPIPIEADIELTEPIIIKNKNSYLMAIPDDKFSLNYIMDWDHPLIGKRWQEFNSLSKIEDIALARTFGNELDHKLMGSCENLVTLTKTGFNKDLIYEDEPVRHKLLDLFGDLMLSSLNPKRFKAKFISFKGGHSIDVMMASRLEELIKSKKIS